jgi:multiple sugar transport system substrate-binding protein
MRSKMISRREFLRLSALVGAGLAAGCVPATTPPGGAAAPAVATTAPAATTAAPTVAATTAMTPTTAMTATTAVTATAATTATTAITGTAAVTATNATTGTVSVVAPISSASGNLSFWNMPFITQEVPPAYVQQWQGAVVQALPNVKVDTFYGPGDYGPLRQKFLLQAKSGTPDVVEGLLEDESVYVTNGLIEALDTQFAAWADKDQFIPATVDALKIGGKLYGIPYNTNARGLAVRKDLLDQYGLKVPTTWADMVTTARTITQKTNKQVYGFFTCTLVGDPRAPQEFISWYFQVSKGQHMFDTSGGSPKLAATAAQFEQVLTLYNDVLTGSNPAMDPNQKGTGWPVEDPGFANGKWAMAPMGPWLWGRRSEGAAVKDILENKTEIVPLPLPDGGGSFTYLEVKPIMMNHFSKNQTAAWDLVRFICSKDEMGLWCAGSGGIPARKDSLTIDAFQGPIAKWVKGFSDLLPLGVALEAVNWGPVNDADMKAVNYVIYGQKTPKDAAQWLVDEINKLISQKTI